MKRITSIALVLAMYGCIFSARAQGQGIDSCAIYTQIVNTHPLTCLRYWDLASAYDPNAPVTRVCCNPSSGVFDTTCVALRPSCGGPSNAPAETCLSCNEASAAGTAAG